MNAGDPIWYRQEIRGGYGFDYDVPGYFVRRTKKRVVVRLTLKRGGEKDVAVSPMRVRPRDPLAVWK